MNPRNILSTLTSPAFCLEARMQSNKKRVIGCLLKNMLLRLHPVNVLFKPTKSMSNETTKTMENLFLASQSSQMLTNSIKYQKLLTVMKQKLYKEKIQ